MRIYLTYYPCPPELLLGLRPGTWLRAVNVHPLTTTAAASALSSPAEGGSGTAARAYAACLRSTVSILRCAVPVDRGGTSARLPPLPVRLRPPHEYVGSVRHPCDEIEWRGSVGRRLAGAAAAGADADADAAADAMLRHHSGRRRGGGEINEAGGGGAMTSRGKGRRRDPYAEFFDHGIEEEEKDRRDGDGDRDGRASGGCTVASALAIPSLPRLIDLGDVRDACVADARDRIAHHLGRLETRETEEEGGGGRREAPGGSKGAKVDGREESRIRRRPVGGGWTGSVRLIGGNLLRALRVRNDGTATDGGSSVVGKEAPLYVAGRVDGAATGGCSSIDDGLCRLALATVSGDKDNGADGGGPPFGHEDIDDRTAGKAGGGGRRCRRRRRRIVAICMDDVAVVTSCLCLGPLPTSAPSFPAAAFSGSAPPQNSRQGGTADGWPIVSLPPIQRPSSWKGHESGSPGSVFGPSVLFVESGLTFVASVQLRCCLGDAAFAISPSDGDDRPAEKQRDPGDARDAGRRGRRCVSILECLAGPPRPCAGWVPHDDGGSGGGSDGVEMDGSDGENKDAFVLGRLVRSRWRFCKVRKGGGQFGGFTLTLSHVPVAFNGGGPTAVSAQGGRTVASMSTSQSAEIRISIPLTSSSPPVQGKVERHGGGEGLVADVRAALRELLRRLAVSDGPPPRGGDGCGVVVARPGRSFSDHVVHLASAWRAMAEDGRLSPILSGGCDEYVGESTAGDGSVFVRIPRSACKVSARGYVRFECQLDEATSYFVLKQRPRSTYDEGPPFMHPSISLSFGLERCPSAPLLDYIGGEKFLPGMLDRRRRRQVLGDGGALTPIPESLSGVPTFTLADVHLDLCRDLKGETGTPLSSSSLAPSLVRRIPAVHLVGGMSFCRARAECLRCFKPLHLPKRGGREGGGPLGNSSKGAHHQIVSGVVAEVKLEKTPDTEEGKRSFWHLPLLRGEPNNADKNTGPFFEAIDTGRKREGQKPSQRQKMSSFTQMRSELRCPSGCPIEDAAIKWECSAVVDDGTGQAKLHAEREAASALLQAGADSTRIIEEGAWLTESGVVFQRSIPPRSYLRDAVREARLLAYQTARERGRRGERKVTLTEDVVLSLLTEEARAEYLLQRHCRESSDHYRTMNILCRVKPLVEDSTHGLSVADIEVTAARCEGGGGTVSNTVGTYVLPPLRLNLVDFLFVRRRHDENLEGWHLVQALSC